MPPERTAPKTKPYKPQRPSAGTTSSRVSAGVAPDSSHAGTASQSSHGSASRPSQSDAVDLEDPADSPTETIPGDLLTTLLHEFFLDENTRITKGADRAVGKYMETFVREAIARANYERSESKGGASVGGDGFLEVEDLEKLAPQLVLDF